ncbi:MAG TPA: NAD(P)H-dependent glycerol-3-phosphate dehydrogenase [Spirochaetia bacterium]|nr:MAG: glycerol-3-phosphate dehydrogenase [Spirochaetes bacterium GWB1_36_13]HCL57597.1 NAD(P)H-dependent glycerol-3-phosphate dehydrogenase [Spirochaetia bacterium]
MIFFKKTGLKIAVLGSGSFGTALASTFAPKNNVYLWGNDPDIIEEMIEFKTNKKYLKEVVLPDNLKATIDIEKALDKADIIIFAVPSQATREVAVKSKEFIKRNSIIVTVAKGLEEGTALRMSQVLHMVLPSNPVVVLAGPSHAEELSLQVPTTVVAASRKEKYAKRVQETLVTPFFRIYTSKDVIGVELGGVLKNIIAIASGITDGLGLGSNTRAALITRGLVEMIRFSKKLGANQETFLGLSGLGDLIVTCTSPLSRNWTLGNKIGKGKSMEQALSEMTMVCEGVKAALVVHDISIKKGIEMPITTQIYKVLFEKKDPKKALADLMTRTIKSEKFY